MAAALYSSKKYYIDASNFIYDDEVFWSNFMIVAITW